MTKSIFIASSEPYSGKSMIALGLVNMLLGRAQKISYFKPVVNGPHDTHIETVLDHFQLPQTYGDACVFTRQEALELLKEQRQGEMLDKIISRFKSIEAAFDFTIVEGSDFAGPATAFEFETNRLIARNLNAPVILLVSGQNKSMADIVQEALNFWQSYLVQDI